MHVFDTTEETVQRGREDDDGYVRAAAAEQSGDLCAKLAVAEVIVEDGDVDVIEELGSLFDGGGGNALVAMLTKDGGAENQVVGLVVKEQDAYWLGVPVRHEVKGAWDAVGRLNHGLTSI
jgi:hypothetical protein